MSIRNRSAIFFLVMAVIASLISACSQVTPNSGPDTTTSSLTPLQVLQNSANTMKQLKSSHLEIQISNNIQTTGGATATTSNGPPVATATAMPQNLNIAIKASGDQALPDQMQLRLSVTTLNESTNLAQVIQGNKVYVQNPQGQWYVIDRNNLQQYVGNPFSGFTIDQNSLLGLVQHAKITDHGIQSLNGENLRRIAADLDKTALRQLLNENPDLKRSPGQQNIDTLLNNTKSFKSTIDVWIDESKFYLHRTQLAVNLLADTSGIGNGAPQSVSTNLNTIVDLSKFNEPVTITPPSNATPTNNPGAIFGVSKPQ